MNFLEVVQLGPSARDRRLAVPEVEQHVDGRLVDDLDLMTQPLKVLCELGGWKTPHTILQCYQQADEDQLRQALADRRKPVARPI